MRCCLARSGAALGLLLAIAGCATGPAGPAMVPDPVREVAALENRRFAAMTARDLATLEVLLADDLVYVHSNGARETKTAFLAALREGKLVYREVRREEADARAFGDAVVFTGAATLSVTAGGKDLDVPARYTAVWARRDSRWRFVSWQSTRIVGP